MAEYIDQDAALAALPERLQGDAPIALDTEFLRERTYRPQLCLVQLAQRDRLLCLDPLALEGLEPLAILLQGPQTKILHAAGQDLEVLHQQLGILPAPLFDTQIAAALCGLGEQIGYAALVNRMLGIALDKTHSRTDWSRRPLSDAQLSYALDDVRYLPELHAQLSERLQRLGRMAWLEEDCIALLDPARWTPEPLEAWRRLKGWQRLPAQAFPRLRQLAAWRERRAQELNRPRRWVMSDEVLAQLVTRPPRNIHALLHGGLIPDHLQRFADEIMAALELARSDDSRPPQWRPMRAEERERLQRLTACIDALASRLELPAGLLITRSELEQIARGSDPGKHLRGWRAELLTEPLEASL